MYAADDADNYEERKMRKETLFALLASKGIAFIN